GPSGGNTVEVRVFSWAPLIQMKPAESWRVSCKTKKPTSTDLIGETAKKSMSNHRNVPRWRNW
ncbi:hypothetical protein, partial [Pseudomonas songnenensis]|uniref:hypothetical protein n=1 Tax=Pseudomonas songnenensis TaxID=1176259 RepID=UPI0028B092A0